GWAGAGFCCCGAGVGAGWVCFGAALLRMTEPPPGRDIKIVNVNDVIMNTIAAAVVALDSSVEAPRAPKTVWLPPPPNVPAQSALLPCCRSTTRIRKTQTIT